MILIAEVDGIIEMRKYFSYMQISIYVYLLVIDCFVEPLYLCSTHFTLVLVMWMHLGMQGCG